MVCVPRPSSTLLWYPRLQHCSQSLMRDVLRCAGRYYAAERLEGPFWAWIATLAAALYAGYPSQ